MDLIYPLDTETRSISTRARSIAVNKVNSDHWEWGEKTGTDHGTDLELEYSENGKFTGKKIIAQIKGTKKISILQNGQISFAFEVKTINYALNTPDPFVLLLVDVINDVMYYLPIQEYFLNNPALIDSFHENKSTFTVHIDPNQVLNYDNDEDLCKLTNYIYLGGSSNKLRKIER